jgi:UDP-N-acetylmuramoyl-tripeptide--D-alanyl-D-alanine ligase
MRKILQFILKILAKIVLNKYHPEVIGLTGSLGKTSAKEAVYAVLKNKFNVRQSPKNYNNELGVPLTILGAVSPGSSILGWLKLFGKFFNLIVKTDNNYPPLLILEMGVDRPGDMKYLTSIVQPHIGIVTAVKNSHLEFFEKVENIKKEKQALIDNLSKNGLAVLNYDNQYTRDMAKSSKFKVLTYGLEEGADVLAQEINFSVDKDSPEISGINFKVNYQGSIVPVSLPRVIGYPAVYAALAAIAVGIYYELNLVEIAGYLKEFALPAGRLNLIPGVNNSLLIDDTYNSSPASTLAALEMLEKIDSQSGRKIVALGDMLELGPETESGHQEIGVKVATMKIDQLILVGEKARIIGETAVASGFKENNISYFSDSLAAAQELVSKVAIHDVVLVKGSQGARMEKLVKTLMAQPEKAKDLLVRQGTGWDD